MLNKLLLDQGNTLKKPMLHKKRKGFEKTGERITAEICALTEMMLHRFSALEAAFRNTTTRGISLTAPS